MKKLLFFSNNQKKIEEINHIFKNSVFRVLNLNQFKKIKDPKENGKTFSENAKIKSKYGFKKFNIPCFADDSGFCVESMNNKPGVKSKRFIEKFSNKNDAFKDIITQAIKLKNYRAYFVTSICLILKEGHYINFTGKIHGVIKTKPSGSNGFGFDPIFIPDGYKKTFAEMNSNEKNLISHRKIALSKMKEFLIG